MSTLEVFRTLIWGRRQGMTNLWVGGGEPTLRRDLRVVVSKAVKLGYSRIKLQTNGMILAYPQIIDRLVRAGITEINFSIKGSTSKSHDQITRTPGSFSLMLKAISTANRLGVAIEGDILLNQRNHLELPDMVRFFAENGLSRFNLWLFWSGEQIKDNDLYKLVPKLSDVVPQIVKAMDLRLSKKRDFITSMHTPPCTVPEAYHACLLNIANLGLTVANPGGYRFKLQDSPMEGGNFIPGCQECQSRLVCNGIRADYLAIFGEKEFEPSRA